MQDLVLIISPRIDTLSSLETRMSYLTSLETAYPALQSLDASDLFGDSVFLVDRTKDHEIYVQLCAGLSAGATPYIVVPLDADSVVVVGMFPETIQQVVEKYIFPLNTPKE